MTWVKIPIQEQWTNANDVNASGFVVKCYLPGTTTATPMAIDKNGNTTVSTATLNADGFPEVSGNEVALYIDRDFKIAVYENASDAAANTNAYWGPIDNIRLGDLTNTIQSDYWLDSYSTLRAKTSANYTDGDVITLTNDGIAGNFVVKTGTVTDNGGTLIVFTDDSNRYAERIYDGSLNAKWFGLDTAGTAAANKTAMDNVISAAFTLRKTIYIPMGFYECNAFTIVPSGTQRTIHIKGDFSSRAGEIIPSSADSIKQFSSVLYFPNVTGTDIAIEVGETGGSGELHGPVIEDIYILGPNLEAGTPTTNTTGLKITDGARDMILRNVQISQFRTGLYTQDVFVFTILSMKISRCQVGAIWGSVSNRISCFDLKINDCTYGAFHTGTGSVDYYSPWFEGQPPTNSREMEYAIVVGSASADVADISFYGGWYEQIQKEFIYVGAYDDGTGAGSGATPNLVSSAGSIDRIRIYGDGHWDSIGIDVSGAKIKIDSSATGIADGCVRVFDDMGNWDWSQFNGPAEKVTSGNSFEFHAGNGYPITSWTTENDAGASGGMNAGLKTAIADNTATTFINFSVPNSSLTALFKISYSIITTTERSIANGEVIVALGRKSGLATQGGVGTPIETTVNISSTESWSAATAFALTGVQAKDTSDTTVETIGLQVTQNNNNSTTASIAYTVEQITGTRQAGVGANYITVSQA